MLSARKGLKAPTTLNKENKKESSKEDPEKVANVERINSMPKNVK